MSLIKKAQTIETSEAGAPLRGSCHAERSEASRHAAEALRFAQDDRKGFQGDRKGPERARNRESKRGPNGQRGEATVEFAMVALLLFLVTFSIIEGGRIFGSWLIITNEAREAARWGALHVEPVRGYTAADVVNVVRTRTTGVLDQAQLSPVATAGPDAADPQWVTVRVDYNVELVTPPLLAFFPNPFPISATSTMRTENAKATGS